MTGTGMSHGAVTVINAIPCGIGATMGVALETRAEFSTEGGSRTVEILNDPDEDTRMAEVCVRRAYERAGADEPDGWRLRTDSGIPASRGLKSSSSACNAILGAVFSEIGYGIGETDLITLGTECAMEAGVTVTGSFDDACGCALGGLVMTDNTSCRIVSRSGIGTYDVVIHVPPDKIRKTDLPLDALRSEADDMRRAIGIAMRDPFSAMTLNGRLIAEASGLDNSLAEEAVGMGALGAGITGTGPATAVVVPAGKGPGFASELGLDPQETIITVTR